MTPGKCQGTRGVRSRACLRPCLRGAHCSAGVRSGRPPFSCPAVASGRTDVGSISIRSSPSLLRSEMAFHCCWSLISILRVCPHFYADELFLVCFASYYLLKSPYTSKPNFSEDPSACLAAPLSLPCGTERPVCRLQPAPPSLRLSPCQVHGQYFRHGVMGGALLTETPLPPAPPFLTPLLSPVSPVSLCLPCRLTRAL